MNLDTFEKFNLSLIEENIPDCERNSESLRGFLFLSPKGMCVVDNSLSCLVHLDWSRGAKEGGFRCSSKWCDHGLAGKSAYLGKSIYFFFCAKRIAYIPSIMHFSM